MTKRLFVVVVATLLLIILSPIMLSIACILKYTTASSVLYRQKRMGRGGIPFTILKFRTLKPHSARFLDCVLPGDSRITRFGQYLRSTHLDELPQLWNIIRGEMSLVGPRPHEERDSLHKAKTIPGYNKRWKVLPGLSGLAQVRGRLKLVQDTESQGLELDLEYIKTMNIWRDICIIARTIPRVLRRQGI